MLEKNLGNSTPLYSKIYIPEFEKEIVHYQLREEVFYMKGIEKANEKLIKEHEFKRKYPFLYNLKKYFRKNKPFFTVEDIVKANEKLINLYKSRKNKSSNY